MTFYYVAIAFNLWMLIDAIRRRAELHWLLIILFVPFGSLIYFAMVKLGDFRGGGRWRGFRKPVADIASLERAAEQTPSDANKLALADALSDAERYREALPIYRDVLARDREDKRALHGLARCLLGSGQPAEAAEHYHDLLELERGYKGYSAALEYAEALWQAERRDDAIELMRALTRVSPMINHRVGLAHYLAADGHADESRQVLSLALSDYESSPAFVQRRDRSWAERARKMLAT